MSGVMTSWKPWPMFANHSVKPFLLPPKWVLSGTMPWLMNFVVHGALPRATCFGQSTSWQLPTSFTSIGTPEQSLSACWMCRVHLRTSSCSSSNRSEAGPVSWSRMSSSQRGPLGTSQLLAAISLDDNQNLSASSVSWDITIAMDGQAWQTLTLAWSPVGDLAGCGPHSFQVCGSTWTWSHPASTVGSLCGLLFQSAQTVANCGQIAGIFDFLGILIVFANFSEIFKNWQWQALATASTRVWTQLMHVRGKIIADAICRLRRRFCSLRLLSRAGGRQQRVCQQNVTCCSERSDINKSTQRILKRKPKSVQHKHRSSQAVLQQQVPASHEGRQSGFVSQSTALQVCKMPW